MKLRSRSRMMESPSRTIAFAAVLAAALHLGPSLGCGPSKAGGSALAARIARIETGLLRAVVVKGQQNGLRLEDRMSFYHVPGVSVAVICGSKLEWARGYGVTEAGTDRPVSPETLFQAASISKPVAAMAALRTVEEGLVGLDDDVNMKLRSWKVPENEFTKHQKVTLRRLLSHSAGLTVHGFRGYAPDEPVPSLLQVLDGTGPANSAPIRVDIAPGFRFRYSGGGYTVMQQLLIDIHGKPFPEIMRELVLEPLGMSHSTYDQPLPGEILTEAAVGHRAAGNPVQGLRHTYPEMAAAGLWTTPSDLARFAIEIMNLWEGKSGRTISPETAKEMLTPVLGGYGLGLTIRQEGKSWSFGHGGSNEGFKGQFIAYPELGQGVAIMTNGDLGSDLNMEVLRAVSAEYGWEDFLPREKVLASVPADILDRYVGDYKLNTGAPLTISKQGERLLMTIPGVPTSELFPESETAFFVTEFDAELNFIQTAKGDFEEIDINYRGRKMKATRIS